MHNPNDELPVTCRCNTSQYLQVYWPGSFIIFLESLYSRGYGSRQVIPVAGVESAGKIRMTKSLILTLTLTPYIGQRLDLCDTRHAARISSWPCSLDQLFLLQYLHGLSLDFHVTKDLTGPNSREAGSKEFFRSPCGTYCHSVRTLAQNSC
jgi:hypothetical protein